MFIRDPKLTFTFRDSQLIIRSFCVKKTVNISSDGTITKMNYYKDKLVDLKKKELTYYGFDSVLNQIRKCNELIPYKFFDVIRTPIFYDCYPYSFYVYYSNLEKNNKINFFEKIFYYFLKIFCIIFNISPYVSRDGIFRFRTFNGFTLVFLWFNLHFFLPFIFSKFLVSDIKGTFFDSSFPTIFTLRQRFCNFFYAKFKTTSKIFSFFFIQFFIFVIPVIIFSAIIYFFISAIIYFFFIVFWRDKFIFRNFLSESDEDKINEFDDDAEEEHPGKKYVDFDPVNILKNEKDYSSEFITFEIWHPINHFWYEIYFKYISSYVLFCEKPKSFSFFKDFFRDIASSEHFSKLYIANRLFYYSPFKKFFKNILYFFVTNIIFIFNIFGFYHFSQFNSVIKNGSYFKFFNFSDYSSSIVETSNWNRKFTFYSYISIIFPNFLYQKFDFSNFFTPKKDYFYKDSIYNWPRLTIFNIDEAHKNWYFNWHYSKFNIDFSNDTSRFPNIDPDFVNFYSKDLSTSSVFTSNFSKYDLDRLYSSYVWKVAKLNKFDISKSWKIFYNEYTIKKNVVYSPTIYFETFLNSSQCNKISFLYKKFGFVYIFRFSIFSVFFRPFQNIFYFFYFILYFFDIFFCFSSFFYSTKKIFSFVSDRFSFFFYYLYLFFLKGARWSFFPFFDYFKNFYINFYIFYFCTNFIKNFYTERSVNKTIFLESLEEIEDEETHFTDTVEQFVYNYWYQDYELDIEMMDFFHDEIYDQFTDTFDYNDDEIDYLNTLYSNDDNINTSHYDFEVHGIDNFRNSINYFEDEVDQEDFEDTYEDLEHFFSPVEESDSYDSDNLFFYIFIINKLIYDTSDNERSGSNFFHSVGSDPYSSLEHHKASYDFAASYWRPYFLYYWGSNVPINKDYQVHIDIQLTRYVSYLEKWHSAQLSSGKYIKIPNILRSFGDLNYTKTEFSKTSFFELTVTLNNIIFPRSKISKIHFSTQIDIIWSKIGRVFSEKPEYVISILEKPESAKIFDLITKSGFEFKSANNKSFIAKVFMFENFFNFIFKYFGVQSVHIKNEKEFVNNFFGQFYDITIFKKFNISPSVIKEVTFILNNINSDKDTYCYLNPSNFNKFKFVKISLFKIICSLFLIYSIRVLYYFNFENFRTEKIGNIENISYSESSNLEDSNYLYLINLFSSIQFGHKKYFYAYLKLIIKKYLIHHSNTGKFSILIEREQIIKEILDYSAHNFVYLSFNILADSGLYWKDLIPNIKKVYENWNDPFVISIFFPEQFYTIFDFINISNFDDEEVDIYDDKIYYIRETSLSDYSEEFFDLEEGGFEDTHADSEEEHFYRTEATIGTTLYDDYEFDDDDEDLDSSMYWYEQIDEEPEYDEWELDFFDEIEDINIPIERIFFGEFYRKFLVNSSKEQISSNNRSTPFYNSNSKTFYNYNISAKFESSSDITIPKVNETGNIFIESSNDKVVSNDKKNSKFFFLNFFFVRIIKFFFYFYYNIYYFFWFNSVDLSCKNRSPLTKEERIKISKHYVEFKHLYNSKFFLEFKIFILNWLKSYEVINSKPRLDHVIFELIRSNTKIDYSAQSPLYHSPFSFSWFEEPSITDNFKWELFEALRPHFDIESKPRFNSTYTNFIDDYIKNFDESEDMQKLRHEDEDTYERYREYCMFLLSTTVLELDEADSIDRYIYGNLINIYFIGKKKNVLHEDLYLRDLYKLFEDDWVTIQNEIGLYKEDPSANQTLFDNPPEEDYIEDPISPFYVSEEEILHSSQEYSNKFIIFLDAIWEYLALIFDYHIYWSRVTFSTFLAYFRAISSYHDKKWLELSIKYGYWVYFIRSFFSFSFLIICSLYIIFVIPRIVFIYTTPYLKLFSSLFISGIISFFLIFLLTMILFSSVYNVYREINEYEKNIFFFSAFISWFTVVWYSIVDYDLYENDEASINAYPSVDPDPTLGPDFGTLHFSTTEVPDVNPTWHRPPIGVSLKPYVAPQPPTFGYFIDIMYNQYLISAHRSLTGHKYREKITDSFQSNLVSESISNYISYLRHKENFEKTNPDIYNYYEIDDSISDQGIVSKMRSVVDFANRKNDWIRRYSDLSHVYEISGSINSIEDDVAHDSVPTDMDWIGGDPIYGFKDWDYEPEIERIYLGRDSYSSILDHSRYFVRNYYNTSNGDDDMVMWNIHFRSYDWFSSSYLSKGFYKKIRNFKPFNYSYNPYSVFKNNKVFSIKTFEPRVKYIDYIIPFDLHFPQKVIYGSSEFHYTPASIYSSYNHNKFETFKKLNPSSVSYEFYISSLIGDTVKFNYLKNISNTAHFSYFYFNRYRYYISKFNPTSNFFSRASFKDLGVSGWPIEETNNNSINIYAHDYSLFLEHVKYSLIGYNEKIKKAKELYYLTIQTPPSISIYNTDFFEWVVANFKNFFFKNSRDSSGVSYLDIFIFYCKRNFVKLTSRNEQERTQNLFNIEKDFYRIQQQYKHSLYWDIFWTKLTSKNFDQNYVSLPSTALIINPNYLPSSYLNSLSIRRHYDDSLNFNKRLFSRKKFKRFWYRNSFVPIIDDNPVRFSENFHNFKSYESGLPIIPSFSENVKDPISKVLERGIRRPIVKDTYSDFLSNLYYKRFYSYIIDNYNVERSFHGWLHEDIAAYDSPSVGQDYLPYSKFIYKTYFNPCNVDRKEVYFKRSVLGYFYQNELLKKLYILNLSRSGSSKLFKKNNFVKGNNSRFYLNQLYRYPFSRSIYRVYYDAINEEEYIRNRIRPGSSLNIFENSTIYIPYFGEKYLYTPIYNQKLNSFEDNRTFVSDYLEDRFANTKYIIDKGNGENIFEPVPPEYSSILDNTVFVWGGRHTGAFFFDNFAKIIKKDFNPYNLQTLDSKTFNEFPFTSNISSKDTNFIKNISTFLSDLSSDDTEALFDYTKEYDWPILEVIFEPMDETNDDDTTFYEPIKYPYNSDIDSYTNTSSIMFSNNNLNSFKSELDADFVPEDEVGKGLDYNFTLKDLKFLQDVTLGELEEEGDFDSSREFFSKIKFINNIGININYGTDVITYQDRKNSSKKVINKVFDEFKDFEIEYDEDLENQEEEEEESYFNEKLGSNYFFSLYFERPIYSRNYSKIFQRKDAFSFALFDRLSNFNINFFDRKSDRRYWLRFPESEMDKMDTNRFNKPSTYKTIYSYYSDNKNRLYFSPLEKYIINSYGNIIRNYSHFNYPFSRYGNKINNLIFERRSLFRSRITSRLQKYVYSKAFEKTFNRVFSGSRVPVTSIDPFKVLINEKEGYPSFEMWADDESTNIFSSTLDLDALSPNFDANLRWKLEQLKNNDRDFRKKKIGNYINTYKLSNKDSEIFKSENEMFYPHINLESILYKKLEIARKKNPRFISNKDLFFVKKNAKLLEKRSEKYLKNDTFIRQTYTGMDFYKYIVLNELRNSNKYEKDISKIRSELNKVRPGYSTHNFKLSKIEIYNNSDFQKVENKDNIKDTELFNKNKFRIDKVQIVNKERRRGEVK